MQSLWQQDKAEQYQHSDLSMRVYTSRLLGCSDDLVLHGGGNTSVKVCENNIFGEAEQILYVKGSGWDLKTIEEPGFAPCRLAYLQRLAELDSMTDTQMTLELKGCCTNPRAPAPSVEAILHAVIPHKFVDHTHADAVVAISNTPDGENLLKELYGDRVLILPYVMPGFILAKQVYAQTRDLDWSGIDAIILLHHGVFTFNDDARVSYEQMISIVDRAEKYLEGRDACHPQQGVYSADADDLLAVAAMRKQVSELAGRAMVSRWKLDESSVGFSMLDNGEALISRGPLTPDHSLHTKRIGAFLGAACEQGIREFAESYQAYFEQHNCGELKALDPAPRYALWPAKGALVFAPNASRLAVVSDIVDHTLKAIQMSEAIGGWKTLSASEIFELEYWELEQAKLKSAAAAGEFEGRIAVVSGAASGIGLACANTLKAAGACVVGLDINRAVSELFNDASSCGLLCDMTDAQAIAAALEEAVRRFGGIDIVVSNAGMFPASRTLEQMDDELWQGSLDLNLNAHLKLLRAAVPFLKQGIDPSVTIVASKNVPAPGPGAGAYSVAKAGLTQMARVAALELGSSGIRINVLHPNAVFDTAVWSDEVLAERAGHYGLSVEQYKRNNILGCEVTSKDVAALALQLAGRAFAKTTGAQIAVDGGNERVI
jgi:rhamnose utilization protein RhaD (predicted bifunctional aldolase and dehydrogenase)/NAD(P)-dependent dehydrogenase (short-subunit alcohol dehydrogenase family)